MFQNTRAKVQFSKLFRNGIQVAPFVDFTSEGSNFKGKERKAEFGGKGINDLYTTRVGSDFLLPLLRGRGGEAMAAGERAATIEAQAGTLEVEHQRAASILRTAQAYWELRAAQESLAILERSVDAAGRPAEGDHRRSSTAASWPASSSPARRPAKPAPARASSTRGSASTTRASSWPRRSASPAAAPTRRCRRRPRIRSRWRRTPPRSSRGSARRPRAGQRRDVEAAMRREEAAAILQRNAVTELRSRLDLSASMFYTALGEVGDVATEGLDADQRPIYRRDGYAEALDRWVGPSFTLTLNYEKPLGNNSAKGRLAVARSRAPHPRHRDRRPAPPGPPQRRPHRGGALRDDRSPEADAGGVAVLRPDDHRRAVALPRR